MKNLSAKMDVLNPLKKTISQKGNDRNQGGLLNKNASVALKMLLTFLLLLSFRFTDFGCVGIFFYFVIFFSLIFHQLYFIRKSIRDVYTNALLKDGSILRPLFEKKAINVAFGIIASLILSLSIMSFLFIVHKFYFFILFMDIFLLTWLNFDMVKAFNNQFNPTASSIAHELFSNFFNVIILMITFIALDLMTVDKTLCKPLSPDIPQMVINSMEHSCLFFQHLIRTSYFFELNIQSLRNLEGIGGYLFWAVYIFGLSFFPFVAVSLIYKSAGNVRINISSSLFSNKGHDNES